MEEDLEFFPFEELEDKIFGPKGTPERDEYEAKVEAEIQAWHIGEAIRKARLAQDMTQEELGEKVGVKKAQISKLEKGKNITIASMSRIFSALGVKSGFLDLGKLGKVALW